MIDNGNGTVTFNSCCGRFTFTCKDSFYKRMGESVFEEPVYNLMTTHNLANYLHNPEGAAIIKHETGIHEFWMNGKQMNEGDAKKMIHDTKFHNKFDSMLDGD